MSNGYSLWSKYSNNHLFDLIELHIVMQLVLVTACIKKRNEFLENRKRAIWKMERKTQ